jgi:hypothetical protein
VVSLRRHGASLVLFLLHLFLSMPRRDVLMTCGPPTADPCRRRGWEGNSALGRDTIGTRHSNRGGPAQGGVMMHWVRAAGPHQKVRGLGLLSCESISRRATCLRLLRSPGTPCRRRTWPLASTGVGAGVVGWANAKRAITSPAGDLQPQPQCSWPPLRGLLMDCSWGFVCSGASDV